MGLFPNVTCSGAAMEYTGHQYYEDRKMVPFEYIRKLGEGAIGSVDEVEGKTGPFKNRIYARKVIILVNDEKERKKELREIENEVDILKKAHHAHIVRLVMTYEFSNNYNIVMDPSADGNLEDFFHMKSPEVYGYMAGWFRCLLSAVDYAHGNGIRHRDIKPRNVLVKHRSILLSDFGISMMGLGKTVPTTRIGQPRSRTTEYCAPEVESGSTRGRSADIFSLGAVFLEMLTVCSYSDDTSGMLEGQRRKLETNGRISYALSVQKLGGWIEFIKEAPAKEVWHLKLVHLCEEMLQENRYERPKVGDLLKWWSLQPRSDLPPANCECEQALKSG